MGGAGGGLIRNSWDQTDELFALETSKEDASYLGGTGDSLCCTCPTFVGGCGGSGGGGLIARSYRR